MARAATSITLLVIAIGCLADLAGAAERDRLEDPFEITADLIRYDAPLDLYVAEGNVRVVQGDRSLKARWVAFSVTTRIGVAEGDVELVDASELLQATFMVFDIDSLQGMLFQAAVDSGAEGFKVRAQELIRTGRNTFTVRDGYFTTCRCEPGEPLPWQIHAGEADVEMGGYGTVKNSTFDVLGVPVLWIPWAFFPVKSDRETGFLLPEFGFGGRGGANVGLPFFWAAHPQLNVTLTSRYFVERGYKQDVELEYVFGEYSGGNLFVAGLDDQQEEAGQGHDNERWAVLWDHDQQLPADLRWQTEFKLPSDNLYADDFIELREFRAFRFLESTTNVERGFGASGGFGAMIGGRYANDLQGSTFDDRDEYILQRFTEARGDVQPGTLSLTHGVQARFESELIHFQGLRTTESEIGALSSLATGEEPGPPNRNDGRFYDLGVDGRVGGDLEGEGDGIFQPGEPLAQRGTRVVMHPRLARPFRLGNYAEFVPEIGWHQTLYRANSRNFAERGLLTGRANLRGRLARDFGISRGRTMRHILEPQIGWALVSQRRQRSNPLFVPRAEVEQSRLRVLSLDSITRNPSDRIESTNQIVFSLGQRFFLPDRAGGVPRLRADLITALDVDFANDSSLGNFHLESRIFPVGPLALRLRGSFNPETVAVKEGEIDLALRVPVPERIARLTRVGTRYRYLRRVPRFSESYRGETGESREGDNGLNQLDLYGRIELTARVRLTYSSVLTLTDNEFIRNRGTLEYVSRCRCWGIGFTAQHERRQGWGGGFEIRFLGLGDEATGLFDTGLGAGLNL